MKIWIAPVFALSLVACSKSEVDGALDKMASFKDKVCACKDKACADKVEEEMMAWMKANEGLKEKKPSEAQEKRGKEIFEAMEKCTEKLSEGDKKPEGGDKPAEGGDKAAEGGDKAAGGGADMGAALAKMKGFADEMCACKDKGCAEGVTTKMTAWSQEMAKAAADAKPNEEQMKAMTAEGQRMAECMTKAMGATP